MLPSQSLTPDDLPQLPEAVAAASPDPAQLQAFTAALLRKREQAVAGRKSSGIEADWLEDEEYYLGIDDNNRQFVRSWVASVKRGIPTAQPGDAARSTVFLNITRPYVDAAASRVADMLLPVDDPCWSIKPTPIAEIDAATSAQMQTLGMDWEAMQAQIQASAEASAKLMETAIADALTECNWHGETRAVIEDAARIGVGILKGPVPVKRTSKKWIVQNGGSQLQMVDEIVPGSTRVDPWNFFPDPSCGERVSNGGYVFERSYLTPKQLRDMRDMPGCSREAIDEVLKQGPKQLTAREAGDGTYVPMLGQYEMWTYYGVVAQKDALAAGMQINDETPVLHAMALIVNDTLIKLTINPLDTGDYPYDVLSWQRRPGVPWGMGIARHIRTPQRMLNAASRAMMDNAGMTAAPQIVLGNGITPADGKMEIRGRKLWKADAEVVDVRQAFYAFVPDSHQREFQAIIDFALELAERTTGMPLLLQGQQGESSKTLGGMQLLQNNASGTLRRLAKRFDDYMTEPHIRRYYAWMMQYSERSDIKGDFQVDVRASSALVERDATKQFMYAAMNFATNPAFGIAPRKLFAELAKSDRMDPKLIQYTEEEAAQLAAPQDSELDKAKATLAQAQAEREKAQTVLTKIESLFSAVNAANLVAANPAIAPAADATAKSAGFVDEDAPPIVAEVPAGAGALDVPKNTSPMFPPNPPQPDAGALRGIEGGQ